MRPVTIEAPVSLSEADWVEIYNALWTKADDIRAGRYPDPEEDGEAELARWQRRLRDIMEKIGPDGERRQSDGRSQQGLQWEEYMERMELNEPKAARTLKECRD